MNKWTFSALEFFGWEHESYDSKEQAIAEARRVFDEGNTSFYVGRLVEKEVHQLIEDAELIYLH